MQGDDSRYNAPGFNTLNGVGRKGACSMDSDLSKAANNDSRVTLEVDVGKVMVEHDAVGGGSVGTIFANNLSTSETAPAEERLLSE